MHHGTMMKRFPRSSRSTAMTRRRPWLGTMVSRTGRGRYPRGKDLPPSWRNRDKIVSLTLLGIFPGGGGGGALAPHFGWYLPWPRGLRS